MSRSPALPVVFALGCLAGALSRGPGPVSQASATEAVDPPGVQTAASRVRLQASHGKARVLPLASGRKAWLGILELDGGVAVPEHADATEEFIHVLEGRGTITVDGTRRAVGPGDTVYMPAGATVSYQNGETPLKAVQVFAGPEPASKYATWTPMTE